MDNTMYRMRPRVVGTGRWCECSCEGSEQNTTRSKECSVSLVPLADYTVIQSCARHAARLRYHGLGLIGAKIRTCHSEQA